MKAILAALVLLLPAIVYADDSIPLDESNFVVAIQNLSTEKIVELLGEPAARIEVKDNRTGEVVGYAWDYEHLNTAANGDYYKTTELDLVDDHVVTIVFSNGRKGTDETTDTAPEDNATPGECSPSC